MTVALRDEELLTNSWRLLSVIDAPEIQNVFHNSVAGNLQRDISR